MTGEIRFRLPFALQTLNERDRRGHWSARGKAKAAMARHVLAAIGGPRYLPSHPFERAAVSIVRCSSGSVDPDSLGATAKDLMDALCVKSRSHPHGLGIIADDSAKHVYFRITQQKAKRGEGHTLVSIASLDGTASGNVTMVPA